MKLKLKDIIKLILSLGLTAWVLIATSKGHDWNGAWLALKNFNFEWILLSIIISIFSHVLRAYRWNLLLGTRNYRPSIFTSYLALMVGYLTSMAIPRLGEVTRCTVLKDQENIPVSFSLGTVITDRLADLLMLGFATLLLLSLEFDLLQSYFVDFVNDKIPFLKSYWPYLLSIVVLGIFILTYVIRNSRRGAKPNSIVNKVGHFVLEMLSGAKAISRVSNQLGFWLSTLGIWIMYFLMIYIISFGYAPTADMSLKAGLAVLVMGSLGMVAPVNNGIGVYQALVASILVIYGINSTNGYNFALIAHGSQLVTIIIIGFLSLLILNFRKRKKISGAEQRQNS